MINEVTYYAVKCDGCGEELSRHDEFSAYGSPEFAEESAHSHGWAVVDRYHSPRKGVFCEDCAGDDDSCNVGECETALIRSFSDTEQVYGCRKCSAMFGPAKAVVRVRALDTTS